MAEEIFATSGGALIRSAGGGIPRRAASGPNLRPITGPRLYGITWDAVTNIAGISSSLSSLTINSQGKFPFSRIVFDEGVNASSYVAACNGINPHSYIMGEILDSLYVPTYTPAQYSARVTDYLNTLGTTVDLWEVGNEINGEWVAPHTPATTQDTADIVSKIHDAYTQVKARGYRAALTLYWSGPPDDGTNSCWSTIANAMLPWATNNVPTDMKNGLDYVLVSFYEDDCAPAANSTDWNSVFTSLGTIFPNSQLGFGENGTQIKGAAASIQQNKINYINKWYTLNVTAPRYISGHFWWYGRQDLLPGGSGNAIWQAFDTVTAAN